MTKENEKKKKRVLAYFGTTNDMENNISKGVLAYIMRFLHIERSANTKVFST